MPVPVAGSMPAVRLRDAGVEFAGRPVLAEMSLDLPRGGVTAVLGPSGCGKTTLLRLLAGLLSPTSGSIERNVQRTAVAFQQPRLLPWYSASRNVQIGMLDRKVDAATRRRRATDLLVRFGLGPAVHDLYPAALSGGMASRVAFARALAAEPDLLLCDEPFAALDRDRREAMQMALLDIVGASGLTVLFVTHDQAEAAKVADHVWRYEPKRRTFVVDP